MQQNPLLIHILQTLLFYCPQPFSPHPIARKQPRKFTHKNRIVLQINLFFPWESWDWPLFDSSWKCSWRWNYLWFSCYRCGGFSPDAAAKLEDLTVVGSLDERLGSCEFVVQEFEAVELIGDVGVGEFGSDSGLDAVQGRRIESGLRILGGVFGSGDLEVAIQEIEFIFVGEMELIGWIVGLG